MLYTYNVIPPECPLLVWDNLLEKGTLNQNSGIGTNAISQATNTHWVPDSLPDNVRATQPSETYASICCVASHNLGSLNATVQVKADNVTIAEVSPEDDSTLIIMFPRTLGTTFMFRIASADDNPSVGYVSIGEPLLLETGILPSYTPLYMSHKYELLNSISRNGQFLGNRIIRAGGKSSFGMNILERDFVEGDDFQGFMAHHNEGNAYFFASNPYNMPKDVGYVWRTDGGEINPTFASNTPFYEITFDLEVYL